MQRSQLRAKRTGEDTSCVLNAFIGVFLAVSYDDISSQVAKSSTLPRCAGKMYTEKSCPGTAP